MKKLIILLVFISTISAKKSTSPKNGNHPDQEIQYSKHKKEQVVAKAKEKPLLQRAFIKVVSDLWDVLIAHAKRWYTALIIVLVIWYKSNIPFPWRNKIASYFQ